MRSGDGLWAHINAKQCYSPEVILEWSNQYKAEKLGWVSAEPTPTPPNLRTETPGMASGSQQIPSISRAETSGADMATPEAVAATPPVTEAVAQNTTTSKAAPVEPPPTLAAPLPREAGEEADYEADLSPDRGEPPPDRRVEGGRSEPDQEEEYSYTYSSEEEGPPPPPPPGPPRTRAPAKQRAAGKKLVLKPARCSTRSCDRVPQDGELCCCRLCYFSKGKKHDKPCNWYNSPQSGGDQAGGSGDREDDRRGDDERGPARKDRREPRTAARKEYTRGSRGHAMSAKEKKRHILQASFARLTWGTKRSRLRTWDMVASTMKPDDKVMEHLYQKILGKVETTPAADTEFAGSEFVAKAVYVMNRMEKYRSAELYLAEAKQRYERSGGQIAPEGLRILGDLERALKRGRGPPSQRDPLPFPSILNAAESPTEGDEVTILTWWLLRAAEASTAQVKDVRSYLGRVGLEIPAAKNDAAALGSTRYLACICGETRVPEEPFSVPLRVWCPPCTLTRHTVRRRLACKNAGMTHEQTQTAPLFETKSVGQLAVSLAVRAGVATKVGSRERFGGHTFRVSGATFLGSTGVSEELISLQGRWRSREAMVRYLRGSPLMASHKISIQVAQAVTGGIVVAEEDKVSKAALAWAEISSPDPIEDVTQEKTLQLSEEAQASGTGSATPPPSRVMNRQSRRIHVTAAASPTSMATWRTRCGWSFAKSLDARFLEEGEEPVQTVECRICSK